MQTAYTYDEPPRCASQFTGRERDTESGLDDFVARFYSSALGRFTIPDWSAKATAVPYAEFGDPQSLNLYTYVRNNPITRFDADGHYFEDAFRSLFVKKKAPDAQKPPKPAPTGPDGKPTPPPVPVPGAPEGTGWKWNPDSQNPRGGTWGPDKWKGPNPPKGSWDENGHWDINRGKGEPVDHYDPDGNPITPDQAHPGNKPTQQTMMDRIRSITPEPILKLGTAGIVIYIIIDEGSRVYPPRNFVPVP